MQTSDYSSCVKFEERWARVMGLRVAGPGLQRSNFMD